MWIRIDCPNGHPVKVEEKYAGRMGRCPACGAKVLIPQPEKSDLSEDAILDILGPGAPAAPSPVTETTAAGPQAAASSATPSTAQESVLDEPVHAGARSSGSVVMGGSKIMSGATIDQPTRLCPACKRKVSIRYQICPHCRTYMPISDLAQVGGAAARSATLSCPHCGVTSFPGASVCGNCGESLR